MKKYTNESKRNDYKWFTLHKEDLYNRYGHKYIAIRNKRILGTFSNSYDAYTSVKPSGTYSVYELLDPKEPIKIYIPQ